MHNVLHGVIHVQCCWLPPAAFLLAAQHSTFCWRYRAIKYVTYTIPDSVPLQMAESEVPVYATNEHFQGPDARHAEQARAEMVKFYTLLPMMLSVPCRSMSSIWLKIWLLLHRVHSQQWQLTLATLVSICVSLLLTTQNALFDPRQAFGCVYNNVYKII